MVLAPAVRRIAGRIPALSLSLAGLLFVAYAGPAFGATLDGSIVDPQGAPVPFAHVSIVGPLGARTIDAAADGRFVAADLPAARYRVIASAEGLSSDAMVVQLGADEARTVRVTLAVAPISESVVVSAAQVDTIASRAPAAITVIDSTELRQRQVDNLTDAVRWVPGLAVARSGGRGAIASLFPRGGESDYTLVLVDGMRLNSFGGGLDLSQLGIDDVDRVEVVRGPQSAVYGAYAIGGVVQVITAHGGPVRGAALVEGGSQATSRAAASTAGSSGPWSWGASIERDASHGETGMAPANRQRVANDDWWQRQLAGSAGWQRSPDAGLRVHLRRQESDRGFPGPFGSDPIHAFPGVDLVSRGQNDTRQAGASGWHAWPGRTAARVRQRYAASVSDLKSDFTSPFGPSSFDSRRIDARTQSDLLFGRFGSGTIGVEAQGERAASSFITGEAGGELPIRRRTIGYFAELRADVGPDVTVTAGMRLDDIRREALPANTALERPAFAADHQVSANPRVSVVWFPWRSADGRGFTRVHASAGTGIRPPDAYEIAFTDNANLEPERSRSAEAGVAQTLARLPLTVAATYFHNTYDDLIVAVGSSFDDVSRFRTDNVSNARSRGLELSIDWRVDTAVSVRAAYTFLDTAVLAIDRTRVAPPPFAVGDPLIRRPRHQGSVRVLVSRGRLSGFAEAGGRGRTLDVEPNLGTFGGLFDNPGYVSADAGVTWRVHRAIEAFARITNMFDRFYEEALGYPALGRSGSAGIRVALSR